MLLLTSDPSELAGDRKGNEGEDWKWRRAFGLLKPGAGGSAGPVNIGAFVGMVGVVIVSPKLLGRRLGGVNGFTKTGEGGAEMVESALETVVIAAVVTARLSSCEFEVLTARFLRLRNFFDGVTGRRNSNTGADIPFEDMLSF